MHGKLLLIRGLSPKEQHPAAAGCTKSKLQGVSGFELNVGPEFNKVLTTLTFENEHFAFGVPYNASKALCSEFFLEQETIFICLQPESPPVFLYGASGQPWQIENMSNETNVNLGKFEIAYRINLYPMLSDMLGNDIDSKDQNVRLVVENFLEELPGIPKAELRLWSGKSGRLEIEVTGFEEAVKQLPLAAFQQRIDDLIVDAAKKARTWIEQVRGYLPALEKRLDHELQRTDVGYDYVRYPTLVHQEADHVLPKTPELRKMLDMDNKYPMAFYVLVSHWEEVHQTRADSFDRLMKD